jgi:hypothetical protein
VGNGNRTRNRRSHSPVLCQLSYSHRRSHYTTALPEMSEPGVRRSAGFISKQEFHRPVGAVSLPGQEAAAPGTQKLTQAGEREAEEKHREAVESSREKNGRTRQQRQVIGLRLRIAASFVRRRLPHPRPTPTYSKPMARSRTESSKFFVSTMTGFFNRCLMRSKSSTRNSGQPVPTTSASTPSAAA